MKRVSRFLLFGGIITFALLGIVLLIYFYLTKIDDVDVKVKSTDSSKSITDARSRHVFENKYKVVTSGNQLIEVAWVEKCWYRNKEGQTIIKRGKQLVVKLFRESDYNAYLLDYEMTHQGSLFEGLDGNLVRKIGDSNLDDTLVLQIVKGDSVNRCISLVKN